MFDSSLFWSSWGKSTEVPESTTAQQTGIHLTLPWPLDCHFPPWFWHRKTSFWAPLRHGVQGGAGDGAASYSPPHRPLLLPSDGQNLLQSWENRKIPGWDHQTPYLVQSLSCDHPAHGVLLHGATKPCGTMAPVQIPCSTASLGQLMLTNLLLCFYLQVFFRHRLVCSVLQPISKQI